MSIDWKSTADKLTSALSASGLPRGELAVGTSVLASLGSAGAIYDSAGNDGPQNRSTYAATFQGWWNVALPAALELDRITRLVATAAIGSPLTADIVGALRAFSLPQLPPPSWTPTTAYSLGSIVAAVPSLGVAFAATHAGTSGATAPTWDVGLGSTTTDGGALTWSATFPALPTPPGGKAPSPLPLDASLALVPALTARAGAAAAIVTSLGRGDFSGLLGLAGAAWTGALAARPTPDAGLDAVSTAAILALNSALGAAQVWLSVASFA